MPQAEKELEPRIEDLEKRLRGSGAAFPARNPKSPKLAELAPGLDVCQSLGMVVQDLVISEAEENRGVLVIRVFSRKYRIGKKMSMKSQGSASSTQISHTLSLKPPNPKP